MQMLKRYIVFNYLNLIIFSILSQNSVSAGIGDKYYYEDYANSYYESGLKYNRDNFKFYLQRERNKILKKLIIFKYLHYRNSPARFFFFCCMTILQDWKILYIY